MTILRNLGLNGRPRAIKVAAAGSPPSQVSNLAAGIVTTSTIAITYGAASGSAPITYTAMTSPHGAAAWTANAASFDGSGGVLTGLLPQSSYDVQIVATNGYGSSTTSLLAGIVTAAAPSARATGTTVATRYDVVLNASAVATGTTVTATLSPNGTWSGQTLTFATGAGTGTFAPPSTTTTTGSSTPVTFTYTPSSVGEHYLSITNSGTLYNPYHAPLNVFAGAVGTSQAIAASVKTGADLQPHQRDAASGNPSGFSLPWAKGWGEVWITLSSLAGATGGLWIKLFDALSNGATTTVGTGTALNASAVQVYGSVSAPGTVRLLLPAGPYIYFADLATDAAFTKPIRIAQRFSVGHVIAVASRSQEAGVARTYAEGTGLPTGVSYTKAVSGYSGDVRYPMNTAMFIRHDGTTGDPAAQTSNFEASSAGAQEIGRIIEAEMGVTTAIVGVAATGGGLDSFVSHDGSFSGAFQGTMTAQQTTKFRWLWGNSGGWDGVDSANYPTENVAENTARYAALVDWIPRSYPACAVIGWCTGASGVLYDGSSALGHMRLQTFWLEQLEQAKPHVVSKESTIWNQWVTSHATRSSKRLFAETGTWLFLCAEVAAFGGRQTSARGPTFASAGIWSAATRTLSLPYKLNGAGGITTYRITQNSDFYTLSVQQNVSSASDLGRLFAVYVAGSYSGNGQAIKITGATNNTASPPSGFDGTVDLVLAGSAGVTFADGSTATIPTAFAVQALADFGVSSGGMPGWSVDLFTDTQTGPAGIPFGLPMRPKCDIVVSAG